jgi:hypothetical protein
LGLVDPRRPDQVANVMPALMTGEAGDGFREIFLRQFTLDRHLSGLADAFNKVEQIILKPVQPRQVERRSA